MYILRVDPELCNKCEDCETYLRGLLENVERYTSIYISSSNLFDHSLDIARAIDSCIPGAIDLEEFTDD